MYVYICLLLFHFAISLPFFSMSVFCLVFFCDDHQILGLSKCGDSWWSWCWRWCDPITALLALHVFHLFLS